VPGRAQAATASTVMFARPAVLARRSGNTPRPGSMATTRPDGPTARAATSEWYP
jgi:hypothetical protein